MLLVIRFFILAGLGFGFQVGIAQRICVLKKVVYAIQASLRILNLVSSVFHLTSAHDVC